MLLLLATLSLISSNFCAEEPTLVTTSTGRINGRVVTVLQGTSYSAFEGIPYAKPPVGPRRFQSPEPIEPWTGTWQANFLTLCAQTTMTQVLNVQGEEDCLHLNVYVPREVINPRSNLNVVVHIHGGGFMYGSGHAYTNPELFMDQNVIFVTFNFRLGIFGFLSTEDDVVAGNMGLKDQVLALQWIKSNIKAFGGNPDSITLTGLSSGGSSVHLHYLSDKSKNLFHRGYSQSGVALNSFALQEDALVKAKTVAKALSCPVGTTNALADCLKQRPFKQILLEMKRFQNYKFFPHAPFGPVLETGANAFLNKNPYYLMAKGQIQDLPWLTSVVSHEGLFPVAFIYKDLEEINSNWESIAPYLLDFSGTLAEPLWKSTAEEIKDFYLGKNEPITRENFLKFVQIFSDRFLVDVEAAIKLQSRKNKSPVYFYNFAWSGDHGTNGTVAHGEDAQYFFSNMFGRQFNGNDIKMKNIVMELLISFVKTGRPKVGSLNWEATTSNDLRFLNISSNSLEENKIETTKSLAPREFWQSMGFLENQNLVLIKDEL